MTKRSGKRSGGPNRTLVVDALTRVEGEGAMHVKVRGGRVEDVKLRIYEPPRFFEALLRGRAFTEAPDITARICGICPVAYQMSACHAMEQACGVQVGGMLRRLRRLLYCGEWIESHALHVYMLHAPDFLGYDSAIHMAADHPEAVNRGLAMRKVGNELLELLGGRAVHPINVRVGGFYKVPAAKALKGFEDRLQRGRDDALETVRWVAGFEFPELTGDYEFVALSHPEEYPMNEGRLVSNRGLDIAIDDYETHFVEQQVAHSTSLHSRLVERGAYLVGPVARYNLNADRLTPLARQAARDAGLELPCTNQFRSILVRGVELVHAFDEALAIIADYEPPERPCEQVEPADAVGHGCTEAPRGILYHRYRIGQDGAIVQAKIVPPTSQNQTLIEDDLRRFVEGHLHLPDQRLQWQCEQAIRNYDPCISCSTHFLKLHIERA